MVNAIELMIFVQFLKSEFFFITIIVTMNKISKKIGIRILFPISNSDAVKIFWK